jgi:hypothetical protein
MTTAYTSLLGLALPVTGELSGTWGDTVNNSITSLVDTAVAGTTNVSADSNVTLTTTTGASNQARQAILLFSGARTAIRTVTAPAQSKIYTVINATTGGFAVTLVGAGPTTGVIVPNGASVQVSWNGSDFVFVGPVGSFNTNFAAGTGVLAANTTGIRNTGSGYQALLVTTTGGSNTAFGYNTLRSVTTASGNTAVGESALELNTGASNSALGKDALAANTTGTFNTAIGREALSANTTAAENTAVGYQAGYANTTGAGITAVGRQALRSNTTGGQNSAYGLNALYGNTTGANNTAIGYAAMESNTTGINNNALGYQAGYNLTTGSYNLFVGSRSGSTGASAITGDANTVVGEGAGFALQGAAGSNTFLGQASGSAMTTGTKNTILGRFQGNQGGVDIRTASGFVVLSDGDGNPLIFTKTGQTVVLQGANSSAGIGIAFPATQVASSDANTLDDYEEGTWTPVMGDVSGNNFTTSVADGRYTKIGNQVTASLIYNWSSIASATAATLRCTLPFACVSGNFARFSAAIGYMSGFDTVSGTRQITSNLDQGLAYLTFYQTQDNNIPAILSANSCSASGGLQVTVTYFV